jgi:hypothetical protein
LTSTKLAEVARPSFARHETFAPRFGWLHKAYLRVREDDEVFLREEAPVILGVGKNMVNAMRYWSAAFKLTIEHPKGGNSRALTASPTWEARWLLDEHGADPYLEDPGSLWLLHWWLLSPTCMAPTWWVAFNALPTARFTERELTDLVERQVRMAAWEPAVRASVERDADCFTKMYAPRKAAANSPGSFEDMLGCPFRELGLLESVPSDHDKRMWRFTSTARTSLAPHVLAYACLDYAARTGDSAGSVSTARLANEPGAPGRAFGVREPELFHALEVVCDEFSGLRISEAVGNRTLTFDRNPFDLAWDVLDSYYGNIRATSGMPTREEWFATHPDLAAETERRKNKKTASAPRLQEIVA